MSPSRTVRAASLSAAFAVFVFALIALPQNPSASHANAGMRAARSVSPQKNSAPSANANANSAAPAAQERAISPDARALFEAANRERTARGLRPFVWDDSLAAAAAHHAQLMAERKTLEHQLPGEPALQERANAAGARFSRVAENIAVGQDVDEIQGSWMHSPGHRANILAPELTAIGVAVAPGAGRLWAVEDFSRQVPNLTLDEQEKRVGALIAAFGLRLSENQHEARRACESGVDPRFGGSMAVVRFETGDLSKLPENVGNAIKQYHYSAAAVGACRATTEDSFARYKIAVLLF